MAGPGISTKEIKLKVADRQLEFLEKRVKELGLSSMTELLKWYIVSDMARVIDTENRKKKRISLRGITDGNNLTDEDFKEAEKIWKVPESL